jgi:hypothetical protein
MITKIKQWYNAKVRCYIFGHWSHFIVRKEWHRAEKCKYCGTCNGVKNMWGKGAATWKEPLDYKEPI